MSQIKCPKCGYVRDDAIFSFTDPNRGLNFCSECGTRLREIPHLEMPPDWDQFEINITGPASRINMLGTATAKGWRFNATGPSYRLEDMLKHLWEAKVDEIRRRNIEIDEINGGE